MFEDVVRYPEDLTVEAGAYSRTPELFSEDVFEVLLRMVDG